MINLEKYPKVKWVLPLLFQYEPIFKTFVETFKYHNLTFPSCELYGSPKCKWTGGRLAYIDTELTELELHKIFSYIQTLGGTPALTFSAINLSENDLKDSYCNMIANVAIFYDATFIVSSDILAQHLKELGAKIVKSSVIKSNFDLFQNNDPEKELKYYNQLLNLYDMIVVRPEFSKFHLIHGYNDIDITKLEIIVNQTCIPNCNYTKEHYLQIQSQNRQPFYQCKLQETYDDFTHHPKSLIHEPDDLKKLINLGVNQFKLIGRGLRFNPYHLLFLLYSQMFNTDGECYRIHQDICCLLDYNSNQYNDFIKKLA